MKNLYCVYIVIKIHELLNITNQDINDFLTNKNKIEIEKSTENIDKLKSLFSETEWIYNYISLNYTDQNGNKFSKGKKEVDKNAKLYDMIVKAFNEYGISVVVGRTKRNNENIVIDYSLYLPNIFVWRKKDIYFICTKFKEIVKPKFFY